MTLLIIALKYSLYVGGAICIVVAAVDKLNKRR